MARISLPDIFARAGLSTDKPKLEVALAAAQSVMPEMITMTPVATASPSSVRPEKDKSAGPKRPRRSSANPLRALCQRPIVLIALALLIVGAAAIKVGGVYWSSKTVATIKVTPVTNLPARSIAGFNVTVPADKLQDKLQAVTHQPVTLMVGTNKTLVDGDTIKGWLQITANKQKTEYYIHVDESKVGSSLIKYAGQYAKAPVDQLTVTEDGTKRVVVQGQDGAELSDPATLKTQAKQTAKNVLDANGMQFSTPLATKPFKAVTPTAFDKLIVADITKKKMWAWQDGKQINSWLVSAGAPDTPTPVGEYHIYAKYTVQDMWGYGPGHKYYFQPHVRWINYFSDGSAIHGVYWHPLSWFGAINSSHGCIGVPDDEAEWIFNWAPVGTPVIVHT